MIYFTIDVIDYGDIFVALSEAKGDRHLYIDDAIKAGASLIIIEKKDFHNTDDKIFLVPNVLPVGASVMARIVERRLSA